MPTINKISKIDNQLKEALKELKDLNLQENELLYDYVFEASRLVEELKIELN